MPKFSGTSAQVAPEPVPRSPESVPKCVGTGAQVASEPVPRWRRNGRPGPGGIRTLALELRWEDAVATCLVIDGQFVVKALSTARVREVDSLGDGSRATRNALRAQGVLVPFGNLLRFTQDYAFDSPSGGGCRGQRYRLERPNSMEGQRNRPHLQGMAGAAGSRVRTVEGAASVPGE